MGQGDVLLRELERARCRRPNGSVGALQTDLAHAYERVLSYLPQRHQQSHPILQKTMTQLEQLDLTAVDLVATRTSSNSSLNGSRLGRTGREPSPTASDNAVPGSSSSPSTRRVSARSQEERFPCSRLDLAEPGTLQQLRERVRLLRILGYSRPIATAVSPRLITSLCSPFRRRICISWAQA